MTWLWRIRSLISRRAIERDLDDELLSHLELRAAELRAQGLDEPGAWREARRRFGNAAAIRERARDFHVNRALESFWQDARYGCRTLTRQPGFALTAVLTLALAIGANGAIFSAIEAVLLRPLPFPHPEQLVFLWGRDAVHTRWSLSPADLDDFRKSASFQAIAALQGQSVNLTGVDEPARVVGAFVSPEYFPVLGVTPALGRTFAGADDQPGAARTAVLGYAIWQARFGADPSILGRTLIFNGEPYTVIGVLPRSFQVTFFAADVWLPSHVYPNYTRDRAQTCVLAIARLAAGTGLRTAQQELNTITAQLARAYPNSNRERRALLVSFRDQMAQDLKPTLRVLAIAVACLLLIACANIANLLLSKAAGRRQEMAIRAAVGAGRMRIVRQLLTESIVLAVAGAALGCAVATVLARYIEHHADGWPQGVRVELNWPVLAFLGATALAAAVLFGLTPALLARRAAAEGLRLRRDSGNNRLRGALVAAQVAMAFLLLAGSGLVLQSLRRLLHVDTGFDGSHVLTLEYRLPRNKYPEGGQQTRFHNEVVARVRALPGVEAAAIVRALPFSGNGGSGSMVTLGFPDRPTAPPSAPYLAQYNAATPGYFDTVRIALREGRTFRESDDASAPRVVVVSESFARRFWPDADAVGRQVLIPDRDLPPGNPRMVPATVIGVVSNTRHDSLEDPDTPQLYAPYAQDPFIFATLVVRTRGNPLSRSREIQRAIWSIDGDQPMWKIRTLQALVDDSLGGRRVLLGLLSGFSTLALFLAGLGLYGVMSYQVARRTAEFGLRVAMGAAPRDILRMVLREGLSLAVIGLTGGVVAAPLFARFLKGELFQVHTSDPMAYALPGLLLLAAAILAVLLPAARATRLNVTEALRTE